MRFFDFFLLIEFSLNGLSGYIAEKEIMYPAGHHLNPKMTQKHVGRPDY